MVIIPVLAIAGIALFAGASFFFALAESALFSLGKWRAQQLAENSPARGGLVLRLLAEPQSLLATIVFGNTFANAGLIATALACALSGWWPLGWTLAATLAVMLIGCEVLPKTLAVRAAERWALRVAGAMHRVQRWTQWPQRVAQTINATVLRVLVPKDWEPHTALTDEEYQELFELAYQRGTLARSEKDIIQRIIQLDRRAVREAMRPRSQMACLSDDLPIEEMVAAARRFKHRRLPLYDETPDTIVGILNTRTLLFDPSTSFEEAIEFPSFVPETMNLLQLFRSFQRHPRGVAIVLNEFGGTAGLITMEDIVEEVIGELHSEGEAPEFLMEKVAEDRWRVNGTTRLEEFRREYPELRDVPGVETMGGWLVHALSVVPAQGESVVVDGLRLTASVVDARCVRELIVESVKRR